MTETSTDKNVLLPLETAGAVTGLPPTVGAKEAARIFGVKVANLRRIRGLAKPVEPGEPGSELAQQLASGPVWLRSHVLEVEERRSRGRPTTSRKENQNGAATSD